MPTPYATGAALPGATPTTPTPDIVSRNHGTRRRQAHKLTGAARRIVDGLLAGAELTGVDMLRSPYRCAHGASRISDLAALGFPITKRSEVRPTVDGQARVTVYTIKPEDRAASRALVDSLDVAGAAGGGNRAASRNVNVAGEVAGEVQLPATQSVLWSAEAPAVGGGH